MRGPEPAHAFQVASDAGRLHGSGAQEEGGLEQPLVDGVTARRRQRYDGEHAQPGMLGDQGDPEPGDDKADVLDAAVCRQALEAVLHERAEDPEHGGQAPRGQHREAPPQRAGAQERAADQAPDRRPRPCA